MMMPLPTVVVVALTLLLDVVGVEPDATLEIPVVRLSEAGVEPVVDLELDVFLLDRSGRSVPARTGDDGIARLGVVAPEGVGFRAVAEVDGVRFTTGAFAPDSPIEARTLAILPRREDASQVVIAEALTLVSAHEGYVVVEQAFVFENDAGFVASTSSEPAADGTREADAWGFDIPLPDGAEGVRVSLPSAPGAAAVRGETVRYFGPIGPPGLLLTQRWNLVVTYSLERNTAEHVFEQHLGVPVRDATVVVLRETNFERAPSVDVDLFVPACDASNPSGVVCFDDFESLGAGFEVIGGTERRAIGSGHADGPAVLYFESAGWPVAPRRVQWAVAIAAAAVVLFGIMLWIAASRHDPNSAPSAPRLRRLESRRRELVAQLAEIDRLHESGELPQSEQELQTLLVRAQLERIFDQIEGAGGSSGEGRGAA